MYVFYIFIFYTNYSNSLRVWRSEGQDFLHPSRTSLEPTQTPVQWVQGLFPWNKAGGAWRWAPTPSNAEVKETVELNLFSPPGPSRPALGWNLIFPLSFKFLVHSTKNLIFYTVSSVLCISTTIVQPVQWSRGLRRRSAASRLLRSWVRIPPGAWMFVCCECYVLSGRGLCDELITRTEESYRLWCVVVCDQETSRMRRPWSALGRSATENKTNKLQSCVI